MKVNIKLTGLRRLAFGTAALALTAAATLPNLLGHASAAGQAQERKVQLSSSAASATSVTYHVSFKPTSTSTVGGIVVDFCADSPIINYATCTLPTGFTLGSSVTLANLTGFTVNTGWSAASSLQGAAASGQKQVAILTNSSAATPSGISTPIEFDLTGITNTSTVGTFYARIYTFDTDAHTTAQYNPANGSTSRPTSFANVMDYGGVAMSTAAQMTVTAKVQESLTFCVYTASSCGTNVGVTLGDGNGVLASTTTSYTGSSFFDLGSNASNGVTVRVKGDTLKAGSFALTTNATCTADSTTASVEQYGLRVIPGGSQSAVAPYNCGSGNHALDITTACSTGDENVTCTYGDQLLTTAGPTASTQAEVEYQAKASTTTKPGVYTSTYSYIATGSY